MQKNEAGTQEPPRETLSEQLNIKVTRTEKQAVRFVSDALGIAEVELLRGRLDLAEIVEEAARMRAKLAEVA